jgi:N4-gp56 family major capsid protein
MKYGDIPDKVGVHAVKALLKRVLPTLIMNRFGRVTTMPKHNSATVKWRRYERLGAAMAPLAEGVPPTAQALRYKDYTAQLKQYGGVVELTDDAIDYSSDDPMARATEACKDQFAETIERLTIETLKASPNRCYAHGVAGRSSVNNAIAKSDLTLIKRNFKRDNVQKITEVIQPTIKISTVGVQAAYYAICHTDLEPDLEALAGFKHVVEYGDPSRAIAAEYGACGEFRFVTSNLITPWEKSGASGTTFLSGGQKVSSSAACDVYPVIVLGKDAYGTVGFDNLSAAHIFVKQANTVDSGDMLGQKAFVSWKTRYACAITLPTACCVLSVACTA